MLVSGDEGGGIFPAISILFPSFQERSHDVRGIPDSGWHFTKVSHGQWPPVSEQRLQKRVG